jgi:Xaa-Pro aminopeptidase
MYYPDLSAFGVDNDRLKSQRLSRLQQSMQQHDLTALMLTDWLNIRYATNALLRSSVLSWCRRAALR